MLCQYDVLFMDVDAIRNILIIADLLYNLYNYINVYCFLQYYT